MLTRKLAVPLINEKILSQAIHCYVATSRITDGGFDFLKTRISPKCRVDMVVGAMELSSPKVMRRILNNYSDTVSLKIHTRGALNANVYIFELPFRKFVGFVGSGTLSIEGIKDQEELFWKITNPKEIESLFSWFTSFFEFGTPLSEEIVNEYEPLYAEAMNQEFRLKRLLIDGILRSNIDWPGIKWKNQYFKREDYQALSPVPKNNDNLARQNVWDQMVSLQKRLAPKVASLKLFPVQVQNLEHAKLNAAESVFVSFSRKESGFSPGFAYIQMGITSSSFSIGALIYDSKDYSLERKQLRSTLADEKNLAILSKMSRYTITIGGSEKSLEGMPARGIQELFTNDPDDLFPINIIKQFQPGDPSLNIDRLEDTIMQEFMVLNQLLQIVFS